MPLGKYHSPTFPPSLPLQQAVLTLSVIHTNAVPVSSGLVPSIVPMSLMITVSPGRYICPASVKYSPSAERNIHTVILLPLSGKFSVLIHYCFCVTFTKIKFTESSIIIGYSDLGGGHIFCKQQKCDFLEEQCLYMQYRLQCCNDVQYVNSG